VPDLKLAVERPPARIDTLTRWLTRAAVALFFVGYAGLSKFDSNPRSEWVRVFAAIGLGEWFRYFTGAMQIVGGVLFLIPRTATLGALLLACTMLGAMFTQLFILRAPLFALFPAMLFGAVFAAWFSTRQ
jgi:putative oxidoreductase